MTGIIKNDDYQSNSGGAAGFSQGIKGLTTGTAAAAGVVGELIQVSRLQGSAASVTSGTPMNVTATPLVLTAGSWIISAGIFVSTSATTKTGSQYPILSASLTSAVHATSFAVPTAGGEILVYGFPMTVSTTAVDYGIGFPTYLLNTSSSVTLYLVFSDTFTGGTMQVNGFLQGLRIR